MSYVGLLYYLEVFIDPLISGLKLQISLQMYPKLIHTYWNFKRLKKHQDILEYVSDMDS